jgi:hypothetical protein
MLPPSGLGWVAHDIDSFGDNSIGSATVATTSAQAASATTAGTIAHAAQGLDPFQYIHCPRAPSLMSLQSAIENRFISQPPGLIPGRRVAYITVSVPANNHEGKSLSRFFEYFFLDSRKGRSFLNIAIDLAPPAVTLR